MISLYKSPGLQVIIVAVQLLMKIILGCSQRLGIDRLNSHAPQLIDVADASEDHDGEPHSDGSFPRESSLLVLRAFSASLAAALVPIGEAVRLVLAELDELRLTNQPFVVAKEPAESELGATDLNSRVGEVQPVLLGLLYVFLTGVAPVRHRFLLGLRNLRNSCPSAAAFLCKQQTQPSLGGLAPP